MYLLILLTAIVTSSLCYLISRPKTLTTKDYEPEELQFLIIEYLRTHPGAWTDEIADSIQADVFEVNRVLHLLEKEGVVL